MIKVLLESLIKANERDCVEQLVSNDEMHGKEACDLCAYRGWHNVQETQANCVDVHGCGYNSNVYFVIKEKDGEVNY